MLTYGGGQCGTGFGQTGQPDAPGLGVEQETGMVVGGFGGLEAVEEVQLFAHGNNNALGV